MSRPRRSVITMLPHLVRARAGRVRELFRDRLVARDYDVYVRELRRAMLLSNAYVIAWCLLPREVLLVAQPARPDSLSKMMFEANRRYTRYFNKATKTPGPLFLGHVEMCVLDTPERHQAVRSLDRMPTTEGLVRKVWHWPWSSAGYRCHKVPADPLVEPMHRHDGMRSTNWRRFYYEDWDRGLDWKLWRCLSVNRPCGDEDFVKAVERVYGMKLSPGKRGPRGKKA